MSLILKSNQVFNGSLSPEFDTYKARVLADGGVLKNESKTLEAFMFFRGLGLNSNLIHSATSPTWGVKLSGANVVKLYNLFDPSGDVVVTSGSYALKEKGAGMFGYVSVGSSVNRMAANGSIASKNISYFGALKPNIAKSGVGFLTMGYSVATPKERIFILAYNHNTNVFNANGYVNSGEIEGVLTGDNISMSIAPQTGLRLYQDGAIVASDNTFTPTNASEYEVNITSPEIDDRYSGMAGDIYLNIFARDLSNSQNLTLSKFASDFI